MGWRILCQHVFKSLAVKAKGQPEAETDADASAEINFNDVNGKRCLRLLSMASDHEEQFVFFVFSIIDEPIQIMTHWFMKYSNRKPIFKQSAPILDLLWPRKSIIVWSLQYLSQMLSGDCPRLRVSANFEQPRTLLRRIEMQIGVTLCGESCRKIALRALQTIQILIWYGLMVSQGCLLSSFHKHTPI